MDDLLSIASKTMENFDPAVDKVDDFEKLPDGEYECLLEEVKSKANEKGTNWISFTFTVLNGENENKKIFVNYFFTEKTVERSIKMLTKLAYEFGYTLSTEAFTSYESLAESLNAMAGLQARVKQTTSKNDFTNYKVTPIE